MTQPPSNPPPGDDEQPWQPPQRPPQQPPDQPPPGGGGEGPGPYGGGPGQEPYGGGTSPGPYGGGAGQEPHGGGTGPGPYGGGAGQGPYGGGTGPGPYGGGTAHQPYGDTGQDPYGPPPGYGGPHGGPHDPAGELASPWRRLAAIIIDYVILAIVGWLITLPFGQVVEVTGPSGDQRISWHAGGFTANLLVTILTLAYFTILHGKFGQTVGKMALRTRVVRAADGGAISYGAALLRGFVMYVLWAICCVGGIVDSVWLLGDHRRQTLHDKAAKTVVVRADAGTPNPYQGR
ncbi:RDD family protein [Spirillospora sp. NPDC049652]